jgi:hypothetical protein
MKRLISYGLAAGLMLATAIPAMAAQSWVVCIDQSKDVRTSTETNVVGAATLPRFFVGAAPVYPAGTVTTTATACTPAALGNATQVGTFFAVGGLVAGLPQSTTPSPSDGFLVLWHFRITGKGAFDTTGPTRTTPTYGQTIIGSTNPGLVPTHGTALVTNLTNGTTTTTGVVLTIKITTP